MRLFVSALVLLFGSWCHAQVKLTGRIIDAKSKDQLAFVPVNIAGTNTGTVADIDGRFSLTVPALPTRLRFSYVGYETLEMEVGNDAPLFVQLVQRNTELREVVVRAEDNPAHRIIRRAYANRKETDGMRYRSYRYTSYSKTVFDVDVDSAIVNDPDRFAKMDSDQREAYNFSQKQHLLLIESATKKSFIPPSSAREEVLAMRVSGLKDPSLLALVAQTETFSIYDPDIRISEKTYLGPLGPSSTAKYRFSIEDTLYDAADSVYVISYRPRPNTKFNGLKGLLYINTDGYAVQNVTAEPVERDGFSIRFQQLHERVMSGSDGNRRWFPRQLNTFIYFDGGNVSVNGLAPSGVGRIYLKDIEVDADVKRKEVRGPELVADRMETRRDDAFWQRWRTDTLDRRDLKTYAVIDSIGDSLNFDKKLKWISALLSGRLPIGPVDLLLPRFIDYNGYEGLRLGAGLATNARISRFASVGGYFGYGFKDKRWKYGGDLTLTPFYGRDINLRLAYENDVAEMGGVAFAGQRQGFSSENIRMLYADRFDRIERFSAKAMFRAGSSLKFWIGSERTQRINELGYRYQQKVSDGITRLRNDLLIGALTADLRWAFREKLARLPGREISLGTRYPIVHVHVLRAVNGLWDGEWETWRATAQVDKTFRIRLLGDLSVRLLTGIADDKAPMPFLFNMRGTNAPGEFLVSADNTFETMRPNEFLADRFFTVHVRHSFGNLLFRVGKFRPIPSIVTSAGIGSLKHPELHEGLSFREMSEPYFESGLRIDRIWSSLGFGVFYRYGTYAFPQLKDNVAFKLSSVFTF